MTAIRGILGVSMSTNYRSYNISSLTQDAKSLEIKIKNTKILGSVEDVDLTA
jgi:hypothetical protein